MPVMQLRVELVKLSVLQPERIGPDACVEDNPAKPIISVTNLVAVSRILLRDLL